MESISWYQSSEEVARGFCKICGSTLFWQPVLEGYAWTSVAMGCLDTRLDLAISKHTFVADKGGYYEIDDKAPKSEGY